MEQNPSEMKIRECPRLSESRLQQWRRRLMKKAQWLVGGGGGHQEHCIVAHETQPVVVDQVSCC